MCAVTGFTRSYPQPSARFRLRSTLPDPGIGANADNPRPGRDLGELGVLQHRKLAKITYTDGRTPPLRRIPGAPRPQTGRSPMACPPERAIGHQPGGGGAPVGAGGGRKNTPTGVDRQGRGRSYDRASPEMRPVLLT